MSFRTFGSITAWLLPVILAPYWFRMLNKYLLHIPAKKVLPLMKVLRLVHKPLALALLLVAATHGYLAFSSIRLHTGSLAWLAFAVTALFGAAFYLSKKKLLFKLHKIFALVFLVLVAVHLLFPNALYYLFG